MRVKRTTELLVAESQQLTETMREMQARIATCGDTRRGVWVELNRRGISQKKIAEATGVTEHTVYLELRKNRENST